MRLGAGFDTSTEFSMNSVRKLRRPKWLDWPSVVLIVLVGVLSFFYEDFKEQFPGLITLQYWSYQSISRFFLPKPQANWVVPVEIDDNTFYGYLNHQSKNDVTDRRYLAELIQKVIEAKPAVLALDINLDTASMDRSTGRQQSLAADDDALFSAIKAAEAAGIPVVLVYGFRHGMQPVPQIFNGLSVSADGQGISYLFPEEELSAGQKHGRPFWVPRYGFDHPADDLRKVPLVVVGPDEKGEGFYDYYSFALQTADAYAKWAEEQKKDSLQPAVAKEPKWQEGLENYAFVYTTFMPVSDFVPRELKDLNPNRNPEDIASLSAIELYCPRETERWNKAACPNEGDPRVTAAPDLLRSKIVLIGGNRHSYRGETGPEDYIDDYQSPVKHIRGMYFQANYIEGLLDNRVLKQTPRWIAAGLDMLIAAATLALISLIDSYFLRAAVTLLILICVVLISGVVALARGYCLDFVFPLVLLLLHPALESYVDLVPGLRHKELVHE
jgi:CHASE2 domain-containing sensor protein